jgi:NAD(P)-dependent dehydrogenase (short-subunit alcohol dehydrogenase family)
MDLQGQVAAITGGSSGIGLAIAKRLAAAGAAVVLGARRADRLQEAVDAIRQGGGKAEAVVMDVTVDADVHRLVTTAEQTFGRLDIMVCNAGFGFYGTVEETDPDVMRRLMDVNFMGTFLGARAALPVFRRQGAGHLLIVSSIVGQRGIAQMSGYGATKAAQVGFAESLRTEFVGSRIHVSVVLPISTDTEFREAMAREFGHSVKGLGPRQTADTVAQAVLKCIYRPVPEVYPHRPSRALTVINAVAPRFADRLVQKYGRRRDT